mmetsp:Transcript_22676/g.29059  ORF Transcript_22676/g.29059 Transcript_22676/m.29059 type:complete len:92 (-) Transcript_22676:236-511(-)
MSRGIALLPFGIKVLENWDKVDPIQAPHIPPPMIATLKVGGEVMDPDCTACVFTLIIIFLINGFVQCTCHLSGVKCPSVNRGESTVNNQKI